MDFFFNWKLFIVELDVKLKNGCYFVVDSIREKKWGGERERKVGKRWRGGGEEERVESFNFIIEFIW